MAQVKVHQVYDHWKRPHDVKAASRWRIAEAAATLGFRPTPTKHGVLAMSRFGYEIPRAWDGREANTVYSTTLAELTLALARRGASLMPFVVDPDVAGYVHRDPERKQVAPTTRILEPAVYHQAFLQRYAQALAPDVYLQSKAAQNLRGFFINDPRRADSRIVALERKKIATVLLGRTGQFETDRCSVDLDDGAGFTAIVAEVARGGAQTIGHYAFAEDGSGPPRRRRAAVAKAVLKHKLRPIPPLQRNYQSGEGEHELEGWLLAHRPDAVVCDCDAFAAQVIAACRKLSIRVADGSEAVQHGQPSIVVTGCDGDAVRASSGVRWMTLLPSYGRWASAAVEAMVCLLSGDAPTGPTLVPYSMLPVGSDRPVPLAVPN